MSLQLSLTFFPKLCQFFLTQNKIPWLIFPNYFLTGGNPDSCSKCARSWLSKCHTNFVLLITNFYWLPIICLGRVCLLCYSKEKKYLNVCCVQSTTTKCTCYQKGMFFFSKLSKRNASHVQSFILGTHTILKSSGHCKSKDQTKQECCISNWFSRVLYRA